MQGIPARIHEAYFSNADRIAVLQIEFPTKTESLPPRVLNPESTILTSQ
jgi:hypothetical protein